MPEKHRKKGKVSVEAKRFLVDVSIAVGSPQEDNYASPGEMADGPGIGGEVLPGRSLGHEKPSWWQRKLTFPNLP